MLGFHACEELDSNCHSCSCLWFADYFLVYWLWSIGRRIHIVQSSLAVSPWGQSICEGFLTGQSP